MHSDKPMFKIENQKHQEVLDEWMIQSYLHQSKNRKIQNQQQVNLVVVYRIEHTIEVKITETSFWKVKTIKVCLYMKLKM